MRMRTASYRLACSLLFVNPRAALPCSSAPSPRSRCPPSPETCSTRCSRAAVRCQARKGGPGSGVSVRAAVQGWTRCSRAALPCRVRMAAPAAICPLLPAAAQRLVCTNRQCLPWCSRLFATLDSPSLPPCSMLARAPPLQLAPCPAASPCPSTASHPSPRSSRPRWVPLPAGRPLQHAPPAAWLLWRPPPAAHMLPRAFLCCAVLNPVYHACGHPHPFPTNTDHQHPQQEGHSGGRL